MDLGLKGKRAIVTGGSLGIGKAIARELAREGVDVAIVARTKAQLETTARELASETGRRIIPLPADVTSKEQVDGMVAQAAAQLGGWTSWSTAARRPAARRGPSVPSRAWSTRTCCTTST
jgi:NAD(P)-dependent dehydrogenase (short-subunit alcohol dehydrogenase family)